MTGYDARLEDTRAFYSRWDAPERAAFLDEQCVAALVLPDKEAPDAGPWQAVTARFQRAAAGPGYAIYRRTGPCPPPASAASKARLPP